MAKVWLSKEDIDIVQQVLEKFPDVDRFRLHEHSQSGIGSCVDMVFDTVINDVKCQMTVPIVNETKW